MYQASASFQQTCLQQMQTLNATVGEACHEVVGQALEKPRTWREYFAKGAQVVKRGMESIDEMLSTRGWRQSGSNGAKLLYDEVARNEAKLMYDEVVDSIEEEPESTEAERVKPGPVGPRIGRFWRCTQEHLTLVARDHRSTTYVGPHSASIDRNSRIGRDLMRSTSMILKLTRSASECRAMLVSCMVACLHTTCREPSHTRM